jgi:steroid delta-isomerase-like uncharacterized protein
MSVNKDAMKKVYDAFGTGNVDVIDEVVSENYIEHRPDPLVPYNNQGRDYVKEIIKGYRQGFPDLKMEVNKMVEEGDTVISFITCTGTNSGTMGDIPSTGKSVKVDGFDMAKFTDGKVIEHWGVFDTMTMMQQLGLAPKPEEAAATAS